MISLEAASSARDTKSNEWNSTLTKNSLVKVQKIEIQIQNNRSESVCGEKVSASQRRQIVKKPADLSSWDKIIKK